MSRRPRLLVAATVLALALAAPAAAAPAAPPAFAGWTIYHLTIEMFANGSPANDGEVRGWRHPNSAGGDLQGVLARVDSIAGLGVDAVWLSPVFAARTSHGYDVTDYFRIADQWAVPGDAAASLELFRQVKAALAARGIATILDLPLNHASRAYDREHGDPAGLRPRATGPRQEAEKVWESWGGDYRYWNFDDPGTRAFLKGVARHWLVDEGVDGLRLDYVRGVPHDFWAELWAELRAARPGRPAFLVGECWLDAEGALANAREIATYYAGAPGPQFDSLLDFPFQIAATEAFARGGSAQALEEVLRATASLYGPGALPTRFLDNHDLARFSAWAGGDADRLVAAVTFLATMTGPIVLYYGTETGLASPSPKPGFTDAGRIPMPWDRLDTALTARVAAALRLRREHPAMSRGERLPLHADRDLLVQAKRTPEQTLLVAANVAEAPRQVTLDLAALIPAGATLRPLLGGSAPVAGEAGWSWTVPAKTTAVVAVDEAAE